MYRNRRGFAGHVSEGQLAHLQVGRVTYSKLCFGVPMSPDLNNTVTGVGIGRSTTRPRRGYTEARTVTPSSPKTFSNSTYKYTLRS